MIVVLVAAAPGSASGSERVLSFEDRLACREKIERVYYTHQIGAMRPFEEAVPREVLERKVQTSLLQSVALEHFWKTPVTAEALERELERIAGNTRLPERLLEVYRALGGDSVLIQECLARPVLVERLARSFFSRDQRIHGGTRREAEELRGRLASGGLDPRAEDQHRSEIEIVREDPDRGRIQARLDSRDALGRKDGRLVLSPLEFDEWRRRAPEQVGQIGEVVEERERFVVSVVLEEGSGWTHLASYVVPKESWDMWWRSTSGRLVAERAAAVARPLIRLPDPVGLVRSGSVDDQGLPFEPWPEGESGPPSTGHEAWRNGVLDDPLAYRARADHTAVWTGSVMVIWGGTTHGIPASGGRYDPLTDTWRTTTTMDAPAGRSRHTAVWTGSVMVVWGGWAGPFLQRVNTGGRYDPVSDTWTPTTIVNAPQAREMHTAVWTGSLMVVWGGFGGADLNTGGRYDPVNDTWKATKWTTAPTPRVNHTAVWAGSVMVVWGGDDNISPGPLGTGGRYDPVSDTWDATTDLNAPEAREGHTAVWTGSSMVVWGGFNGITHIDTGSRYEPVSDNWSPMTTVGPPEARAGHTAIWTGTVMVVWGGASDNTGGRYDPVSDNWSPTSTLDAPEARYTHTAVWTGSLMVVWGGFGGGSYLNTGGRYDPVADSWSPTSTGTAPQARSGHTAAWTGSLMIVWGGSNPGNLNTGSRYDPLTDSWNPTSTLDAPEPRGGHASVWTGGVMVVWGGKVSGGPYLTSGGRYDPLADTWAPTSTVNAPTGRWGHTAVWTGNVMVVWGGLSGAVVNTGGRYDPVADAWAATTTVNAPTGRYEHTAVWTGSVMVVWGGLRGERFPEFFKTGGRYDPLSDTWAPTSTTPGPQARALHTAVWTGSVMVVWGGLADNFGTYLNTGGRYDPVADAWTATATLNAPQARALHTAVWTGSKVIVWGGAEINLEFNTGGRYDPMSDSWLPTTTANAPEGRENHTAVWTGNAMLVWGGSIEGVYLDTGGRYGLFGTWQDGGRRRSEPSSR